MPFYEYQCSACQHHVEVLQKISDAPLRKCPDCGKQALKRLISAPVFRLKGSGWYETDFKSDNEQKRNIHGREEGESKPSETAAEGSAGAEATAPKAAESKPESAKEAAKPTQEKPAQSRPSGSGSKRTVARKPAPRKAAAKPASRKKSSRR